jgi:hypothetical protein
MDNLKITIDHLKNYLGTGLNVYIDEFGTEDEVLYSINGESEEVETNIDAAEICLVRPICYRLSDLDKFIPELGFVPIEEIRNLEMGHCDYISKERDELVRRYGFDYWIDRVPNGIIQKLFTWHFWPFGEEYFEQGLVIDKMKQQ